MQQPASPHPPELSARAAEITALAAELFAAHGFDGVTTRQIAAAAGLNIATVHHHVGSKRDLYLKVIYTLYEQDRATIDAILDGLDDGAAGDRGRLRDALLQLVNAVIDLFAQDTTRARLYMRRWLEERDEFTDVESRLSMSLYQPLRELLLKARRRGTIQLDVDPLLFIRSFDWILYGYFVAGPIDNDALRGDPHDPKRLRAFKRYVNEYLLRMLQLDEG